MLIGESHLNGIQILTLDILHKSHLHDTLVLNGTDIGRNGRETSQLGSTPAAFSCDNLVFPVLHLTEGDGLDDANLADAVCQFL